MAHQAAALKAIRQTVKLTERNRNRKRAVRELTKASLADLTVEKVRAACKAIDKAVQKGTMHAKTGDRKKSRLMQRLNAKVK